MQDAFDLLGLPRRPWLDEADVRAAFQRAAARAHPDAETSTSKDFAELTKAYQTIRYPAFRLKHLLALETTAAPQAAGLPPELISLFPSIAKVRETVDRWSQRRRGAASALERAIVESELPGIRQAATSLCDQIEGVMDGVLDELRTLDAAWPSIESLPALAALQVRFSFLEKWQSQLREALLRLDIGPA